MRLFLPDPTNITACAWKGEYAYEETAHNSIGIDKPKENGFAIDKEGGANHTRMDVAA